MSLVRRVQCTQCLEVLDCHVSQYDHDSGDYMVTSELHDCGADVPMRYTRWVRPHSCVDAGTVYGAHLPKPEYEGFSHKKTDDDDFRQAKEGDSCVICGMRAFDQERVTAKGERYMVTDWRRVP